MSIENKTPLEPKLYDLMQTLKLDIFRTINCVKVGSVIAFDPDRRTVQVQLAFRRVLPNGDIFDYPILIDCPVVTPQGGGGSLVFPIAAGDECLVLFSDRNIDAWFQSGGSTAPFDSRAHDIADGIAIVGLNSLASTLVTYLANEVALTYTNGKLGLKGGKATVAGASGDLLTSLILFIDLLKTLTVTDESGTWPLSAASIASLEAFKTQFQAFLYT